MRKFQKIIIAVSYVVIYLAASTSFVNAAELYFESTGQEVFEGEEFIVDLMLDTEGQQLNAFEGEIVFSNNLRLISINEGGSFIDLWIQKPIYKNGKIIFSGIVPGGYRGGLSPRWKGYKPGEFFKIIFKAKESGLIKIDTENAKVLLNDGKGTSATLQISNFSDFIKTSTDELIPIPKIDDNNPPEAFTPQIVQDPSIFGGKYFLVFNTQDKGSGIYYYKVREGRRDFEIVESPYVLKSQGLYDSIVVQAVDKAGKVREEKLPAINKKPFYMQTWLWVIFIVVVLLIWIYRKKV